MVSQPSDLPSLPQPRDRAADNAHFPLCWQLLSMKLLEAWARWEQEDDSLYIQYVSPCLESAEWPAQPSGTRQPYSKLMGTTTFQTAPDKIQSRPGCYTTTGPPGQLRGVSEGNLSTQQNPQVVIPRMLGSALLSRFYGNSSLREVGSQVETVMRLQNICGTNWGGVLLSGI